MTVKVPALSGESCQFTSHRFASWEEALISFIGNLLSEGALLPTGATAHQKQLRALHPGNTGLPALGGGASTQRHQPDQPRPHGTLPSRLRLTGNQNLAQGTWIEHPGLYLSLANKRKEKSS